MSESAPGGASIKSKIETSFKNDIIKEALRSQFTNAKGKITDDAVELMTELTKVLATECAVRAAKQASLQNQQTVNIDHIESVLPQLMLDFP